MDIIEIEQELVNFWGAKLRLTIDRDIFRASLSKNMDGMCVMINNEVKLSYLGIRRWNCQLLGKYPSRDTAMRYLSMINEVLPLYGIKQSGVIFDFLTAQGGGDIFTDTDNGIQKYFITFNMTVGVLTNGSQVKQA